MTREIPNISKLTADYLRGRGVDRVRVTNPGERQRAAPWVRLAVIDAPPANQSQADHLIAFIVDCHCYAGAKGGQPEADATARLVRARLCEMPDQAHDSAVVTAVRIVSMPEIPDPDIEPARERVIVTARIWAHST